MLRTVFTLLFISSIVVSAKADAYSQGFITAIIIDSFSSDYDCESKENTYTKYNLITMDTSLSDFPKTNSPQCYNEKVKIKSYIKTEWYHRLIGILIISIMLYPFVYTLFCGSDEDREMMLGITAGYIIARRRRRRHCY